MHIKPEAQAQAAREFLLKIADQKLRVRVGRGMLAEMKKDEAKAVEKAFELVMRGNTGSGPMGHIAYIGDLTHVEQAVLSVIEQKHS